MTRASMMRNGRSMLPPVNISPPVITGTPTTGQTVTASRGVWANSPGSFAWQWTRNGLDILLASASTYALVSADEGQAIAARVVASSFDSHLGSASATSSSITPGPAPAVPDIGPGTLWTGPAGSGFAGSPPTDPVMGSTDVKPNLYMDGAFGQAFDDDIIVSYDSEAFGGVSQVEILCEGASPVALTESVLTVVNLAGVTIRKVGYHFRLKYSLFAAHASSTAGIDVYARSTANDVTMLQRVLGPTIPVFDPETGAVARYGMGRFYPRPTSATGAAGADPAVWADRVYKVGASGSGGIYTTYGAALLAAYNDGVAAGAAGWAANIHFVEGGTYEADDCSFAQGFTGVRGFWVVDATPAATVRISRAVFPTAGGDKWVPGPNGMEFRGTNLTVDLKNISFIALNFQFASSDKVTIAGTDHFLIKPNRQNCATLDNTAPVDTGGTDPLETYYFRKQARTASSPMGASFLEGGTFTYLGSALSGAMLATDCRVRHTIWGVAVSTNYVARNFVKNTSQRYFFTANQAMSLAYTGGGTADAFYSGSQWGLFGNPYFFHLRENGVEVSGSPIQLSPLTTGPFFDWSQVATWVNTHTGFNAVALADPVTGRVDTRAAIAGNANDVANQTNGGVMVLTSTPQNCNAYQDFHQDFVHSHEGPAENFTARGNTIVGNVLTPVFNAYGLTLYRLDSAVNGWMLLDNAADNCSGIGVVGSPFAHRHLYIRGSTVPPDGFQVGGGGYDAHCGYDDNVSVVQFSSGTNTVRPYYTNSYLIATTANDATAYGGAPNAGNLITAVHAADFATFGNSLYTDPANGNFKATSVSGGLQSDVQVRAGKYDMFGFARNPAGDIPGPMAAATAAPSWPF